jgi:hemolysin III
MSQVVQMSETAPPKPLLRGVLHQVACFVALVAGALLVARVSSEGMRDGALVYMVCLTTLFGVSGAYHVPTWTPRARQWMRRLDHAAIFLLIAGTYTPLSMALSPQDGATLRRVVWGGAIAGVVQSVLWVTAPKPLIAVIYVILGWSILPYVGKVHASVGPWPLALILVGGVVYSLGALVYARKRPDPMPRVFGYHEVFHTLVIVAAMLHFSAVALITLRG